MLRLLIAEHDGVLGREVKTCLSGEYEVILCRDGNRLLELVAEFDPDIVVTELRLPGVDGLSAVRMIRDSGRSTAVFVMSDYWSDHVLSALEPLGISGIFTIPCAVHCVANAVRDAAFRIRYPDNEDWCAEWELDRILLSLGFHMGRSRYFYVHESICVKYEDFGRTITKEVYPLVAEKMDGNAKQVEKAVRDTVQAAFSAGDPRVWRLYFEPMQDGLLRCPTNDAFITRIARALMQRERLRLPYCQLQEMA